MKKTKKRFGGFDALTMFICLIFGVIWSFVGYMIYSALHKILWTPLVIGLYFAGLAVMQILALLVCGLFRGSSGKGNHVSKSFSIVLIIFAAATVLDFIYELRIKETVLEPTSYIFLIDDSESNKWNDKGNSRGDAYLKALESCDDDFPYAVYSFRHDVNLLVPMTTASNPISIASSLTTSGGTDIINALDKVLQDIKNEQHPDAGKAPRIILISDGEIRSTGLSAIHRLCKEMNVSICTVGYGDSKGGGLLAEIAEGAYGISIAIDDVANLNTAMANAASAQTQEQHNLLNFRDNVKFDILYVIERILFVLILGVLFLIIKAELTRTNVSTANTLPAHIILLLISGASLEFGINIIRLPVFFTHIIMCALFLLTFTVHEGSAANSNNDDWSSFDSDSRNQTFKSFGNTSNGNHTSSNDFDLDF